MQVKEKAHKWLCTNPSSLHTLALSIPYFSRKILYENNARILWILRETANWTHLNFPLAQGKQFNRRDLSLLIQVHRNPAFSHVNRVFYVRNPHDWTEIVLWRKRTQGMSILDSDDQLRSWSLSLDLLFALIYYVSPHVVPIPLLLVVLT